jgi:protein involved in polysaccharide export with SLBB domain
MKRFSLRRPLSLFLVVSLVTPSLGSAQGQSSPQPTPPVAPARPVQPPSPAPVLLRAATPGPDYRLGPGDVLDVQIAGRLETIRQQPIVDLEGAIHVPPIGAIPVGGVTLLEAHRRVAARARDVFRFAEASITVIAPRAFELVISGEVERPGTLLVTATRHLHDVVLEAGGVTPRGSLRRIVVSRRGVESEMDLLAFQLRGDVTQNPFMEEGVRIHVPPRAGTVTLAGAVRRPGEYELGSTPSLRALLALVGGMSETAAGREARLTRIGAGNRKETITLDLATALRSPDDVMLQPGDAVFVPPISVLQDVVEIRGAFVGTPESGKTTVAGKPTILQRLELAQGERVRDVVERVGGPSAHADLRLALVERSGSAGPRQRIPIDLHRLLVEKDEAPNIVLQNGDIVVLPIVEDRVFVLGEVKSPGPHDFRPDLTPREYVALAGGPTNRARLGNTSVTFRSGRTYEIADAPPLEPGAVVTVPEVAVKWWQDYVTILQAIASLVTAYTGVYILFNGGSFNNNN